MRKDGSFESFAKSICYAVLACPLGLLLMVIGPPLFLLAFAEFCSGDGNVGSVKYESNLSWDSRPAFFPVWLILGIVGFGFVARIRIAFFAFVAVVVLGLAMGWNDYFQRRHADPPARLAPMLGMTLAAPVLCLLLWPAFRKIRDPSIDNTQSSAIPFAVKPRTLTSDIGGTFGLFFTAITGLFCMLSGLILAVSAMDAPANHMQLPPFEAVWAKRAIGIFCGCLIFAIGLGLFLRKKIAWLAFLVICGLYFVVTSTTVLIYEKRDAAFHLANVFTASLHLVILSLLMWPAFRPAKRSRTRETLESWRANS